MSLRHCCHCLLLLPLPVAAAACSERAAVWTAIGAGHGQRGHPARDRVLLTYQGQPIAAVDVDSKWTPNKALECLKCSGTSSLEHPAVQMVAMERGKYYMGEPPQHQQQVQHRSVNQHSRAAYGAGSSGLSRQSGSWSRAMPAHCRHVLRQHESDTQRFTCAASFPPVLHRLAVHHGLLPAPTRCPVLLGGKVTGLQLPERVFPCATPSGGARHAAPNTDVLAFQCRNPIHRAALRAVHPRPGRAQRCGTGGVCLVHPTCGPTQVRRVGTAATA